MDRVTNSETDPAPGKRNQGPVPTVPYSEGATCRPDHRNEGCSRELSQEQHSLLCYVGRSPRAVQDGSACPAALGQVLSHPHDRPLAAATRGTPNGNDSQGRCELSEQLAVLALADHHHGVEPGEEVKGKDGGAMPGSHHHGSVQVSVLVVNPSVDQLHAAGAKPEAQQGDKDLADRANHVWISGEISNLQNSLWQAPSPSQGERDRVRGSESWSTPS